MVGDRQYLREVYGMDGKAIAEKAEALLKVIGDGAVLGEGEEAPNESRPDIYCGGLVTIGENSVIPAGVRIGKNVMISGQTREEDYPGGRLASGKTLQVEAQMP